jgi:hypothetical protein
VLEALNSDINVSLLMRHCLALKAATSSREPRDKRHGIRNNDSRKIPLPFQTIFLLTQDKRGITGS